MKVALNDIKASLERLAAQLNVPQHLLPTYGYTFDSHPYIELSENGELCYEVKERGETLLREYALNLNHLLYLVFRDITLEMASKASADNTADPQMDSRRLRDEMQLHLLAKLNVAWMEKERERQINNALAFPYRDKKGQRDVFIRELMGNGFFRDEAEKKAQERFP